MTEIICACRTERNAFLGRYILSNRRIIAIVASIACAQLSTFKHSLKEIWNGLFVFRLSSGTPPYSYNLKHTPSISSNLGSKDVSYRTYDPGVCEITNIPDDYLSQSQVRMLLIIPRIGYLSSWNFSELELLLVEGNFGWWGNWIKSYLMLEGVWYSPGQCSARYLT